MASIAIASVTDTTPPSTSVPVRHTTLIPLASVFIPPFISPSFHTLPCQVVRLCHSFRRLLSTSGAQLRSLFALSCVCVSVERWRWGSCYGKQVCAGVCVWVYTEWLCAQSRLLFVWASLCVFSCLLCDCVLTCLYVCMGVYMCMCSDVCATCLNLEISLRMSPATSEWQIFHRRCE